MNATRPSQECDRETEATNERLSEMTMWVTSNRECLRCYNALWLSLLSPVISEFPNPPQPPEEMPGLWCYTERRELNVREVKTITGECKCPQGLFK